MEPKIIQTADGSLSLRVEEMDETYHSTNGALTEARHVFISNGLALCDRSELRILEVGFGTGLNAIVTLDAFLKQEVIQNIHYTSLEKYPLDSAISAALNYGQLFSPSLEKEFNKLHQATWEKEQEISPHFTILKKEFDLLEQALEGNYDLIYYDAFAPSKQASMWEAEVLKKVVDVMTEKAILSTYCAKGTVRRALQTLGLEMHRLPGPPGKREMLMGRKA